MKYEHLHLSELRCSLSASDIVNKEMFTLEDQDSQLLLRPDGTAPVVRALLNQGLNRHSPVRRLFLHQ